MRSATIAIDCRPDEQKRLMVIAGTLDGQPGAERGDARDVQALLRLGHGAAEDDVVDLFGLDRRPRAERFAITSCAERVGARVLEAALVARPNGVRTPDNDCDVFRHVI